MKIYLKTCWLFIWKAENPFGFEEGKWKRNVVCLGQLCNSHKTCMYINTPGLISIKFYRLFISMLRNISCAGIIIVIGTVNGIG